jgi:hypothetical protein
VVAFVLVGRSGLAGGLVRSSFGMDRTGCVRIALWLLLLHLQRRVIDA